MSTYQWGGGPEADAARGDDVEGAEEYERFLDAPEHAWWASPDVEPTAGPAATTTDEARDHQFGNLSISFELDDPDPYEVLRIPRSAPWETILAAYRRLVGWWHPEGLGEATDVEREACEDRIRVLNTAYQELQLRRGR
jgi:hypothetical protein